MHKSVMGVFNERKEPIVVFILASDQVVDHGSNVVIVEEMVGFVVQQGGDDLGPVQAVVRVKIVLSEIMELQFSEVHLRRVLFRFPLKVMLQVIPALVRVDINVGVEVAIAVAVAGHAQNKSRQNHRILQHHCFMLEI